MRPPVLAVLLATLLALPGALEAADRPDPRALEALAKAWFAERPATAFGRWDPARRAALLARARALGPLPEGALAEVRDLLWKGLKKALPRPRKNEIETPYGPATFDVSGKGGPRSGLLLGLHGGGEGAGDKGEAAGSWRLSGYLGIYPQGIRLVHDTWNTVHGEAFVLTLLEIAKTRYDVDPDRVVVAGFSMGGTGAWHLAGRHPDLLAAAIPAHGVLMAAPRSQVGTKEEVEQLQNGLLPNVRNLPVWFYTGLADQNCRPGTFLYAWDVLQELRQADPGGYEDIHFEARPGLAHAYPPGEPQAGLAWAEQKRREAFPTKLVWEYASDPFPLPDAEDKVPRPVKEWFYWLRCVRPVDGMTLTAIRKGNEIDLEVTLAFPEDVAVYLNPSMIDVNADVVVRVAGQEVYRGRPVPDVETVLESLDARVDRTLVFDRKVVIPER